MSAVTALQDPVDASSSPSATQALLEAHRAGDPDALGRVLALWRDTLVGYFVHCTGHRQAAEDLAQDVLVRAVAHLDAVDTTRSPWPWLMTIARHRLVDHYRRGGTRRAYRQDPRVRAVMTSGATDVARLDDLVTGAVDRELLRTVLDRLTPRQRSALLLRHVENWSHDDIAALLGTSRNAVQQLLLRACRSARREYLALTDGKAPRCLVPLPILWVYDALRRAPTRVVDRLANWQASLAVAGESVTASAVAAVATVAVTASVVAGVTWVANPPVGPGTGFELPARPVAALGVPGVVRAEAALAAGGSMTATPAEPAILPSSDVPSSDVPDTDWSRTAVASRDVDTDAADTDEPAPLPSADVAAPEPAAPAIEPELDGPEVAQPDVTTPPVTLPVEVDPDRDEVAPPDDGPLPDEQVAIDTETLEETALQGAPDTGCDSPDAGPVCDPDGTTDDTVSDAPDTAVTDDTLDDAEALDEPASTVEDAASEVEDEADATDAGADDTCGLDPLIGTGCDSVELA